MTRHTAYLRVVLSESYATKLPPECNKSCSSQLASSIVLPLVNMLGYEHIGHEC